MSIFSDYTTDLHDLICQAEGSLNGKTISIDDAMDRWIKKTHSVAENGNKIFFIGNGASATMAEHLGFDAMQNGNLKTINFSETSYITAVSNDFSYADVFLLKLQRMAEPGDLLISISSSGNSPNVVKALEYAKANGIYSITVSAMEPNNHSRLLGDIGIYVPAQTYGLAESLHGAIMHSWLDMYMDKYLGGRH